MTIEPLPQCSGRVVARRDPRRQSPGSEQQTRPTDTDSLSPTAGRTREVCGVVAGGFQVSLIGGGDWTNENFDSVRDTKTDLGLACLGSPTFLRRLTTGRSSRRTRDNGTTLGSQVTRVGPTPVGETRFLWLFKSRDESLCRRTGTLLLTE